MQFLKTISIKTKMTAALLLILLPYFAFLSYESYSDTRKYIRKDITKSVLPLASDNIYSDVQADLIRPIFVSSLMSNDTFLKDWVLRGERPLGEIKKYLRTIKAKYGFFSSFFVSSISRKYYYYGGVLKKVSPNDPHDVWFYRFLKKKLPYVIDVDTDQAADNTLTVFINHRLNDYKGKLLGVTGVGLKMEKITQRLQNYSSKYDCEVYFIDNRGNIQAHSSRKKILNSSIKEFPEFKKIYKKVQSKNKEENFFKIKREGHEIQLISRYISEFDWHLIIEIDETSRVSELKNKNLINFFISLVVSILIIAIAVITVNYFQTKLSNMASIDDLTGVYNRRELYRRFESYKYRHSRFGTEFSLLIFDIDLFKKINDTLGHNAGDSVLKDFTRIANENLRKTDSIFRYGGDEFIVIFEGDGGKAYILAERIRLEIENHEFAIKQKGNKKNTITISCGIAQYRDEKNIDDLISKADKALYKAKESGKNITIKFKK